MIDCGTEKKQCFDDHEFYLGAPVVDDIPAESGIYVLRTREDHDVGIKVRELQDRLTKHDLIKIYHIGYRPDKPIPVSRYFTKIHVELGNAEEWQKGFGYWYTSLFHRIATGMKEDIDE